MTVQFYPNGIGGTAPGDSLDLARPLQTSGNVWYVSSLIGTDAAAPAGQNREKPLATVAQAVTNSADDDIIVFLPGHTQTLVAPQSVSKRLTFIGEGTTSGKPSVSFTAGASTDIFNVSAVNVELRNIYFPQSAVVNTGTKVFLGAARARLVGCYFEQGAFDTGNGITLATCDQSRIERCTLISVAPTTAAQPLAAIRASGVAIADLEFYNTVVSAGVAGFSNYAAIDLQAAGSVCTRVKGIGLSLLLGADVAMGASATGYMNVQLSTGGSRVAWS